MSSIMEILRRFPVKKTKYELNHTLATDKTFMKLFIHALQFVIHCI